MSAKDSYKWAKTLGGLITTTQDGSLSFEDFSEHAAYEGEAMHSEAGALSESLYVYLPCLENSLKALLHATVPLNVCSVGLGLGYLEMITAAHCLQLAAHPELRITSYESNPERMNSLRDWLLGKPSAVYEKISSDVAGKFAVKQTALFHFLRQLLVDGYWNFRPALNNETVAFLSAMANEHRQAPFTKAARVSGRLGSPDRYQVIYYDAYSEKSCPMLWTEDFLIAFLDTHAHPELCTFATYASRSVIKRALRARGFAVPKRKGFMNKRECTLAERIVPSASSDL